MTEREALKLALEVLVEMTPSGPNGSAIWHKQMSAITAASEALAQPELSTTVEPSNHAGFREKTLKKQRIDHHANLPLAQPEQEPVAYGMWDTMIGCGGRMMMVRLDKGQDGCTVPLYTTPPQGIYYTPPQRKPLTDEQERKVARLFSDRVAEMCNVNADDHWKYHFDDVLADVQFVLKAAHGIKGDA